MVDGHRLRDLDIRVVLLHCRKKLAETQEPIGAGFRVSELFERREHRSVNVDFDHEVGVLRVDQPGRPEVREVPASHGRALRPRANGVEVGGGEGYVKQLKQPWRLFRLPVKKAERKNF